MNLFESLGAMLKPNQNFTEPETARKYPKEVYEIHDAFNIAGQSILDEANAVLKECEGQSVEKGKRLLSLGFKQSKESVIAKNVLTKEHGAKEMAELVSKYRTKYPNNKFITVDQVNRICEKWGLVCGDIEAFKGFVPEKNLNHIESFLKKHEFNSYSGEVIESIGDYNIGDSVTIDMTGHKIGKKHGYYHFYDKDGNKGFQSSDGVTFYSRADKLSVGINEQLFVYKMVKDTLKICAPLKDMDTTGMRLVGNMLTKNVPDPVVLQPVKGGYLIVTAWGDEASDEDVVDHNMN